VPKKKPPARPVVPQDVDQLGYAAHLLPFDGVPPHPDALYDTVRFDGADFEEPQLDGARFLECALTSVGLNSGSARGSHLSEVWMHGARIVGTQFSSTEWQDVQVLQSVLAGLPAYDSVFRRVTFQGCKFNSVNLRESRLEQVVFEDCLLRDVDWSGSRLTDVSFPGSTLEQVRGAKSTLKNVDFRDAARLGFADGHESLPGGTISTLQLMELAPYFAASLNIKVEDRG
jgi:uncharacterized protein YjbI with pentapeptide repeats